MIAEVTRCCVDCDVICRMCQAVVTLLYSACCFAGCCLRFVFVFGFGSVVVGESRNFQGGLEWLRSLGVRVVDLDSDECASLLAEYIRNHPEVWNEDIGEE